MNINRCHILLDFIVWACPAVRNGKQAGKIELKICLQTSGLQWDSNQKPFAPQAITLDHSVTLADDELCLKVLHNHVI